MNQKVTGITLFLGVLVASVSVTLAKQPQVIYGEDNRADLHEVQDPRMQRLAGSVAGLIRSNRLEEDPITHRTLIKTRTFGKEYNLCRDEPYWNQPVAPNCSAALVGRDLILTAGHCISGPLDCEETAIVFGYASDSRGRMPESIPTTEVYYCNRIEARRMEIGGVDFALVRLDREVRGRSPLPMNFSGKVEVGTRVFVLGHPAGLPLKIAGGASVRDSEDPRFFIANLDTYHGSSGGPVFNAVSGKIEGIVARGDTDFVYPKTIKPGNFANCRISNRCANEDCTGEDVTRISAIAEFAPILKGR